MTPVRAFRLLVVLHVLVWTVLPAALVRNPPLDTVEMLHWGHEWRWGYYKHPPLPCWIAEAAWTVSGGHEWGVLLAAQLLAALTLWSVWSVGKAMGGEWRALLACLALASIGVVSMRSLDLNHNVAMMGFGSLTLACLYHACRTGRLGWWLGAGVGAGLVGLSKYTGAAILLPCALLTVLHPAGRRCWRTPGPYLALAACGAIVAPHIAWLARSEWVTIHYASQRVDRGGSSLRSLWAPIEFLGLQLGLVAPMMALAIPITGWLYRRTAWSRDPARSFDRAFVACAALGPTATHLLIALASGARIHDAWGVPLVVFVGLGLVLYFGSRAENAVSRRWAARFLVAGAAGWTLLFVGIEVAGPLVARRTARTVFPGRELAARVDALWRERVGGDIPIVIGDMWCAGQVGMFAPGRPHSTARFDNSDSWMLGESLADRIDPWADADTVRERGAMIVWTIQTGRASDLGPEVPPTVLGVFPEAEALEPLRLAPLTIVERPPLVFGVGIIRPRGR